MPSFNGVLNDEDIRDVIAYIESFWEMERGGKSGGHHR